MSLFDLFRKKDAQKPSVPYSLVMRMTPYRLYAHKSNSLVMSVSIKNLGEEQLLTSLSLDLPDMISMDKMEMVKTKEFKVGEIAPNETKELKVELFGGLNTDKGEYTLRVTVMSHFMDYSHVINSMKSTATIGVV
jgi:uncharacterized membrane protein